MMLGAFAPGRGDDSGGAAVEKQISKLLFLLFNIRRHSQPVHQTQLQSSSENRLPAVVTPALEEAYGVLSPRDKRVLETCELVMKFSLPFLSRWPL